MALNKEPKLGLLFEDMMSKKYKDPKISLVNGELKINPAYFNFYLLSSTGPIFIFVYILFQTTEPKYLLASILGLIGTLIFVIGKQLLYYNTIIIKPSKSEITILPCPLMILFKKIITIRPTDTSSVGFEADAPLIGYTRKVLILRLKNGSKIKLISTANPIVANDLTNSLNRILRQL